jgi:hypothetical protein
MKVKIQGYIGWEKPWRKEDHGFSFTSFDPSNIPGRVTVRQETIEVEVPDDFDPRPELVDQLKKQKEEARAEFAARVVEIDRQINELMALEHKP